MIVLMPVDGSDFTTKLLHRVTGLADFRKGGANRVVALHVHPALPGYAASFVEKGALQGFQAEASEAVFAPVRAFFEREGIEGECRMATGQPAAEIIAMAKALPADMIAMGSHGHGTLGRLLLGSVTTKVIAGSEQPVLIVR